MAITSYSHYIIKLGASGNPSGTLQCRLTLETFGDLNGAIYALSLLCIATLLFLVFAEERNFITMQHSILKLLLKFDSLSLV
jgi:hypothetical protein